MISNIFLVLFAPLVLAWSYPENNCYNCYYDETYGKDGMYYCRHDNNGLIWGTCCRKGTDASFHCNEQNDREGWSNTRCSVNSAGSEEMRYFYCLPDPVQGLKACGLPDSSSYELVLSSANRTIEFENVKQTDGNACYF